MSDHNNRNVAAPGTAVAWAAGAGGNPGRWLHDEASVARAAADGETIWRTQVDPRTGQMWLRGVSGHAPLADLIHLATDVDHLRTALLGLAEDAADALSGRGP